MERFVFRRTIDPERVVIGYTGDFGVDVPYASRQEVLRALRRSINFCENWLRRFVLANGFRNTYRLRQRLLAPIGDLFNYEQYLRWNVEFRFATVSEEVVFREMVRYLPIREISNMVLQYVGLNINWH